MNRVRLVAPYLTAPGVAAVQAARVQEHARTLLKDPGATCVCDEGSLLLSTEKPFTPDAISAIATHYGVKFGVIETSGAGSVGIKL